jgi:predicted nucleotidyltransferase
MIATIITERLDDIKAACKKYGVKSLYLFGSAATGKFNGKSDFDFIVDYYKTEEGLPLEPFDYFDLMNSLEEITNNRIDLVVQDSIRNKYFKEKVDREKVLLYAA